MVTKRSYVKFQPCFLPKGTSCKKLIHYFEFLSPIMLIMHGSRISRLKFSTKRVSDVDIICVSSKAAFWPLEQLYKKLRENLKEDKNAIDVSIITYLELASIITEGSSSLSSSIDNGFSVIYMRESNELPSSY
ncbi:MAG: hypothetical protein ABR909_11780 [Candidatus Bathyarchaeia archaeon]|jgi:hypothetical protein